MSAATKAAAIGIQTRGDKENRFSARGTGGLPQHVKSPYLGRFCLYTKYDRGL